MTSEYETESASSAQTINVPEPTTFTGAAPEPAEEAIDGLAGFPPEEVAPADVVPGDAFATDEERELLTVEAHPVIGRTARYRVGSGDTARIVEVVTPPVGAP